MSGKDEMKSTPAKSFNIFGVSSSQFSQVRVHPLVIVGIADAYARRTEGSQRSIGTLIGHVSEGNTIEITDCFPVNHKDCDEDASVMMDQDYHKKMLSLKKKVCNKESVVGWFSTGSSVLPGSVTIHHFYQSVFTPLSNVLPTPIHLVMDCDNADIDLTIKGYVNVANPLVPSLAQFHEIPLELYAKGLPETGLSVLQQSLRTTSGPKTGGFEGGIKVLMEQLKMVKKHVSEVNAGKRDGEPALGRQLSRLLSSADAVFVQEQFDELCNNTLQDSLLCVYLSQLARTQTALAEKIHAFSVSLEQLEA